MAAKLGTADVSFRLGAGEVAAVYLGSQEVWTAVQAVTLYFQAAGGGDWNEADNWWLDDDHTIPAGRIPTASDSVYFAGLSGPFQNSGDPAVVVNLTTTVGHGGFSVTVTGTAYFFGTGRLGDTENIGEIIGNAEFYDSTYNFATVTGDATFNDTSYNQGTVTGTATFNDSACNAVGTAGTFVPAEPPECPE
jgi:hypothetical protein